MIFKLFTFYMDINKGIIKKKKKKLKLALYPMVYVEIKTNHFNYNTFKHAIFTRFLLYEQ